MKKFKVEFNQCKEALLYIVKNPGTIEIPPCFDRSLPIQVNLAKEFSSISGWCKSEKGMMHLTARLNKGGVQRNYINGIRIWM